MNRNKLVWSLVAIAIAAVCVFTVINSCKSFDFATLISDLKTANPLYIAGALTGTAGFIFWEGIAIVVIANGLSKGSVKGIGLVYSTSDLYFSAITPSATGGQPASLYFLVKDGMSVSMAGVVLLLNLVMYSLALTVLGLICVLIHPEIILGFSWFGKLLVFAGYVVIITLAIVYWMLIFKEQIIYCIASRIISFLHKIHLLKDSDAYMKKLDHTIEEYKDCADSIKGKTGMMAIAFACNLFQRASQLSVTPFSYLAVGGSPDKFLKLFCVQGITAVGSNSVPIPGAMGAADYLLLQALTTVKAVEHTANLELMSRGISFYLCTILCGLFTAGAYIYRMRRKQ